MLLWGLGYLIFLCFPDFSAKNDLQIQGDILRILNEKFWICVGSKGLVLSFKLAKIEKLLVNQVGPYVTVYLYQDVTLAARNNCDSLYWSSVPRYQQQQAESLPRPSNRQVHLGTRRTMKSCGYLGPFPSSFYLRQCSWNSPLSTIWNAVVWPQWLASYPLVSFLLPLFANSSAISIPLIPKCTCINTRLTHPMSTCHSQTNCQRAMIA